MNKNSCIEIGKGNAAFTLAEVVITLIVIGIVSAITIPMMNNDVNNKKWNVARQKAQATIGEAFKLATINGYVTSEYDNTKDFVTKVLTKYLKINKQCDTAIDCGFSSSVKRADGKSSRAIPTSWTDSTGAYVISGANGTNKSATFNSVNNGIRAKFNSSTFFQTLDGFSVAFFFNPYCASGENDRYIEKVTYNNIVSYRQFSLDEACMNAVYDMNGKQGPNRVGQDIGFVGSFYNGYNVKAVSVLPHKDEKRVNNSLPNSSGSDSWLRAQQYCAALHENDWKVPDLEELGLLYLNRNILLNNTNLNLWSSVSVAGSASYSWYIFFCGGDVYDTGSQWAWSRNSVGANISVLCVRKNTMN